MKKNKLHKIKPNNFIFSIIMPIYNVEKWLEEAIESVIRQKDIDFEKDVQLILVNDCSPDNSGSICERYSRLYPNNILYIKNSKNRGLSNTRNNGLEKATGKYINFFDPDDILSNNVLSEVYKFFNIYSNLSIIAIPLVFFEAATGLHPKYKLLGSRNRIIDLDKEGYNFILSSASSFYKLEDIKKLRFDSSLFGEEDTLFNFEIYKNVKCIGYVCENGVQYNYRRRDAGNSQVDQSRIKPQAFYTPIQLLEKVSIDKKSTLFYELCIYELRSRLKNLRYEIFNDKKEYEVILEKYRELISKIPKEFILNKTKFISDYDDKIVFLTEIYKKRLSINKNAFVTIEGKELFKINDLPIDIKRINISNNVLNIELLFNNYGLNELSIVLMNEDKRIILPVKTYATDSIYIKQAADVKSNRVLQYFKFELPLISKSKYKFYFKRKSNGYLHIINRIRTYSESPFLANGVFNSKLFKLYSNLNTSVTFFRKEIIIEPISRFTKLANRIKCLFLIKKVHNKFKWLRLLKIGDPRFWLFNDRPINANDNSEYLFGYINKNHKKLAKLCYFVLDKNSPDIDRIRKIGNVVIQNSLKHKILYLNAKYIFTSHLATSFFKPFSLGFLKYYNDLIESKIIWLQHGVTMNDIEIAANKFNKQVSKVITSASFEYSIFKQPKFFYEEQDIIESGFPRYDKLKKKEGKTILIMPTWRSYLSGKILSNGLHEEKDDFMSSDYFKNFYEILSNLDLQKILKDKGYKIKFILHPGFKQYAKYFLSLNNEIINVINETSFSYNKIFNESCLLITDYSSVFFDFSYKKKPCLFFQFDQEQFYGKHYKKGIFDFDTMAPGKVIYSTDEIITEITQLINNNMKMPDIYINRVHNINKYDDNYNSERIFMEIMKNE